MWGSLFLFFFMVFFLQYGCYLTIKTLKINQHIYALTPVSHQVKKLTPSFGGVGLVLSIVLGVILFRFFEPKVIWWLAVVVSFSFLGFIDDFLSFKRKDNQGLTAKLKFLLQVMVSLFFLFIYSFLFYPLTGFEWAVYLFVFVATPNATNLSDGLDGLLTGLAMMSCIGFYLFFVETFMLTEHFLVIILFLSLLVFLLFNRSPAKIFMGDTGSLAIGAAFAAFSLMAHNPFVLIALGAVYGIETLSVIIQVGVYKYSKKRVFLMAPLHHHFELLGLSEKQVVRLFWMIGFVFLMVVIMVD